MSETSTASEQSRLVSAATRNFHFDWPDGQDPHGSFSDSVAHTHCICWGAAWRMLDYLRALPVEQRMRAMGMRLGYTTVNGRDLWIEEEDE